MKPEAVTTMQWLKYNLYFVLEHFMGLKLSEKFLRPRKMKMFNQALNNQGLRERAQKVNVKDIEYHSYEEIKDKREILLQTPLVFRGVANDWPAVKEWSKDFFRQDYGDTAITMIDNPGLVDKTEKNVFKHTTFEEYFKEMEKDKSTYLRFSRVLDNNPALLKYLDMKWLQRFKSKFSMGNQTFLFIGEGDTKTPAHAAISHTIFVQIKGRKRWVICAPGERFFVDPFADRLLYYHTDADFNNADDPAFPMLPYVKKYDITLEEGDVLWLPSFFWHQVENVTPTIGVAYKYQNLPETFFKISKVMFVLTFLATKPSMLRSYFYNLINKQDYIYNTKSAKFH